MEEEYDMKEYESPCAKQAFNDVSIDRVGELTTYDESDSESEFITYNQSHSGSELTTYDQSYSESESTTDSYMSWYTSEYTGDYKNYFDTLTTNKKSENTDNSSIQSNTEISGENTSEYMSMLFDASSLLAHYVESENRTI